MSMAEAGAHARGNDSLLVKQIMAVNGNRTESAPADVAEVGNPVTVVIDRRILIRDCLVRCLKDGKKNDAVLSFATTDEWLKVSHHASPGSVIVLSSAERTEAEVERDVTLILQAATDISIVMLSDREDVSSVLSALDKGVRGYIPTSMAFDVAVQAIRLVRAGGTFVPARTLFASRDSIEKLPSNSKNSGSGLFTPRQLTVVEALRQGKANKIIAYELNMCESTVKVHVRNIMKKLRARNRTEVAFLMNGVEDNAYQSDMATAKASS